MDQLAIVTLGNIILFNKRRSEETSKLHVEVFQSRAKLNSAGRPEFISLLTPLELELCKRLTLVQTPGKFRRTVPILMYSSDVRAIELSIKHRLVVGVVADNPYVFARV